ncbi:MAG: hypothetical protein AB1505_34440, partial [Candidatus Latescibacterota bacterium]
MSTSRPTELPAVSRGHSPEAVRGLAATLALALVVRFLTVLWLGNWRAPEAWEYGRLADALLQGRGWSFAQPFGGVHQWWMPPVYPLLLAGLGWLLGAYRYLALELLQAVLSAATVALLRLLGRRLLGGPAAWAALVLAAVYPPLTVKVAYVDPVTLEAFLLVLGVLLVVRTVDAGGLVSGDAVRPPAPAPTPGGAIRSAAAAGVVLGLGVLTRPVYLACVAGLVGAWLLFHPGHRAAAGLMLACVLLTVLPWTLRNWRVHGQPVLVSTNGGFNFWIGNNPLATGDAYAPDGEPLWTKMPGPL